MNRPAILIPNFNHKDTIVWLLDRLAIHQLPCLIVNDGSGPETRRILELQQQTREWVTVLRLPERRGKGGAVLAGLLHLHASGYTHAVQLDADGQHDPADVPRFLALSAANPEALILGKPVYGADVPRARLIGRQFSRFWVWIETLSFAIADPMLGFRVYPLGPVAMLARRYRLGSRMDFDPEIAVRLHWEGVPIENLATTVIYPAGGTSHFLMFRDNLLITWLHTRLVFGMLARLPRLLARGRT